MNIDFPKFPYPKDREFFHNMAELGKELCDMHLLKTDVSQKGEFVGSGKNAVEKYKYDSGRVIINNGQYFNGISQNAWNFLIGGYQPLQKWLKDRKGTAISAMDIKHYLLMNAAIEKTIEMMKKINEISFV